MAWTFSDEIHSLTNLDTDSSTTATSGETLSVHATQWLTDGARDVINVLSKNPRYVDLMSSVTTLNASLGTTLSLTNAMVGDVSLYDGTRLQGCRRIAPHMRGRASDINDLMNYATTSDPVYWINAKTLETYPTPTDSNYVHATTLDYPSVAYSDSSISSFPDEAEHLVVLYASIKALQYQLNTMHTNTDITTAIGLVKTAIDQAATAADKFINADSDSIFGDEETFLTSNSQLTRVKNALDQASDIINGNQPSSTTDAFGALADEDTEILQGALAIVSSEIKRANAHLSEWVAIGDMRVKEVQTALNEANGYISEMKSRMERDSQQYQWYQSQLQNLKQDYQQGIALLVGGGQPQPQGGK